MRTCVRRLGGLLDLGRLSCHCKTSQSLSMVSLILTNKQVNLHQQTHHLYVAHIASKSSVDSKDNGAKREIAKKRAMVSNDNNKMMATEATAQHCCRCHHCPCFSNCGSSLCFGALVAAGSGWWQTMRTAMFGAHGWGRDLCVEFYFIAKLCFYVFASCTCGWDQVVPPKRYIYFYAFTFQKMCLRTGSQTQISHHGLYLCSWQESGLHPAQDPEAII